MTMIRHVLAIFVLARMCVSLVLILLDGASSMTEAAAFMIALIGFALVALVIGGMSSRGRADGSAQRELDGRSSRPVTAR